MEEGTADLFLFDSSSRQVQYIRLDQEQMVEVSLTKGQWASTVQGFGKGQEK